MVEKKKRVALISNDKVGKVMAGPGIRYFELAKALSGHFEVLLLVPDATDIAGDNFQIKSYNSKKSSGSIAKSLSGYDVVICQNLRPPLINFIKRKGIRYIADLYDPLTIEVLEYTKYDSEKTQVNTFWFNYWSLILQINSADHILCSSDRQKDFYLGILSDQGRITPMEYLNNPDFDKTISLAPFGLKSTPPEKNPDFSLTKKFPEIKSSDKIIFWGGGIWDWFDPISVLKAIKQISQKRSDIKMVFLGVKHPNPKIKEMATAQKALDFCKENNLLDKYVFFNFGWTPYEERANYLLSSTIGISTHFDNLETRFSFRTRILDYLWAELPIIITGGDSMADLVEKERLGKVVRYKNSSDIADSIEYICDNKDFVLTTRENIRKVKKQFYWETIANNISRVVEENKFRGETFSSYKFWGVIFKFYLTGFKKKFFK